MKNFYLLSLLLSIVSTLSNGQENKTNLILKSGPEIDVSGKEFISDIVGHDQSGFYVAKERWTGSKKENTTVYIEHYNPDLILTKSVKAELESKGGDRQFSNLVYFNDVLYLFSFFSDEKLKKNVLYVQTVDKSTLIINNDIKLIDEIEIGETKIKHPKLYYSYVSRDSSKLLILSTSLGYKDELMKYNLSVFDSKLNVLWNKQIVPESLNAMLEFEDLELQNNGDIHILELHLIDRKEVRKRGRPNYKYRLLSYLENGSKSMEYFPSVEGKFLCDLKMSLLKNGDIFFGGLYSGTGTFDAEGALYFKFNPISQEVKSKVVKEIGKDFFSFKLTGEHERVAAEFKLERLYDYYLDQIIVNEKGEAVLVCEQYYYYVVPIYHTTNGKTTSITYEPRFKFRDIALINISEDGKNDWMKKFNKTQYGYDSNLKYLSHFTCVMNNQIFVIYNDFFEKSESKDKAEKEYMASGDGVPFVHNIGHDGSSIQGILKEPKEKNFALTTNLNYKVSANERIGLAVRGSTYRFVKYLTKN